MTIHDHKVDGHNVLLLEHNKHVSIEELVYAVDRNSQIVVSNHVRERINTSRTVLDKLVENGSVIYGVNTGMGGFVDHLIPLDIANELQSNLIQGVSTNVGDCFSDPIARATMLARIISLSRGNSAISLENFDRFIKIYNAGLVPEIPMKGSLGTSGDLGPLAVVARMLTGDGFARLDGERMLAIDALEKRKLRPLELSYKEGLALINGTSCMVAHSAYNIVKMRKLIEQYSKISAFSFEALGARVRPFHPEVHKLKPHNGQLAIAEIIWNSLSGSGLAVDDKKVSNELSSKFSKDVKQEDKPIEDAYSIRCTPQILGPVLETLDFSARIVEDELNSSNDNPLITPETGEVYHNGHFHGQYVAAAMDYLTIGIITLCNLSDRRIDRFLTCANSNGLPPFLCAEDKGLRFGLMGGQFMSSSLTAENRSLATPVSIQTLTTTGDFQDVVSFGLIASRRTAEVLKNTLYVVAFELICAAQAADIRGSQSLSSNGKNWYNAVRAHVPYLDKDVALTDYFELIVDKVLTESS